MKVTDKYYILDDGKKYHRVTAILSMLRPGIERLKITMPDLLENASIRGKTVHKLADAKAKGTICQDYIDIARNLDEKVYDMYMRYDEWFNKNVKRVIASEIFLKNDMWRIAGTCDLVAEMNDGDVAIVDIKTGEKSKTDRLQTAAYMSMYNDDDKEDIDKRIIVYLKNKLKAIELHDFYEDYELFQYAYKLYTMK